MHPRRTRRPRRADSLLWAAGRLGRVLDAVAADAARSQDAVAAHLERVLHHQAAITAAARRILRARAHRWHAAARLEQERLATLLEAAHHIRGDLLRGLEGRSCDDGVASSAPLKVPSLLQELRQLQEEFDDVGVDRRRAVIAVVTDPVELEGVALGRFRVELHLGRLRDRQDVAALTCVALQPNPAAASSLTTHPHVHDTLLCAGDASVPLHRALRQGRLCDAFLLVNAVLQTYNPASPYVSLDDWHGIACADCDETTDEASLYRCESCDRRVCDQCIATCDGCDGSVCLSCVERVRHGDDDDSQFLCPGCRTTCPSCGHAAPSRDVDELGVCRACHDADLYQRELEEQENDDHEPDPTSTDTTATPATTTTTTTTTTAPAAAAPLPVP